jgi:hypothetical protein
LGSGAPTPGFGIGGERTRVGVASRACKSSKSFLARYGTILHCGAMRQRTVVLLQWLLGVRNRNSHFRNNYEKLLFFVNIVESGAMFAQFLAGV